MLAKDTEHRGEWDMSAGPVGLQRSVLCASVHCLKEVNRNDSRV